MTHIAVLGSTNMDLVAYVEKAPQRGETVPVRAFRTIPGGKGANQAVAAARVGATVSPREALTWAAAAAALSKQRAGVSASLPYRSETETQYAS